MKLNENDIQGLKAQEAKDLAIRLVRKLKAKDKAPVSAGEVQLKELQYELRLKEAESEDNRQREAHLQRLKELELQIEQEKTRQAQAESRAEKIREEHARLVEQVQAAKESLSIQLEQATREHNLRVERLEAAHGAKAAELKQQQDEMEGQRDRLREEIAQLAELTEMAGEISRLRESIESRRNAAQQELQQLDEEFAAAEFEKTKRLNEIKRRQELERTELETQHQKHILQANQQAAEKILKDLGMLPVKTEQWEQMKAAAQETQQRGENEVSELRQQAREAVLKQYNITTGEVTDVTDLYYRHQAASREAETLRAQVDKLDAEVRRMREHIEHEPQRIAAAVEAAKVQVQNTIEQGGKR